MTRIWPNALAALAAGILCGASSPTQNTTSQNPPAGLSASDWNSIRGEYERHRHAAYPVAGGHRARNAGQRWVTEFDGGGFTVQPDDGAWRWGLKLESYGFAGQERAVKGRARVTAEVERVSYDWDESLREWFINDGRGLEHGFTLGCRPAGGDGPLWLRLSVRGGLRPEVQADGSAVRFLEAGGRAAVHYAGLKVWDADGRRLAARFEANGPTLRLAVKERGARYPLTIDPIAQQAYLKASNTGVQDQFGHSVAVSGDTVVVGANGEGSNATGVNGNGADNSVLYAGAAYVFVRTAGVWSQQAYLKASNTGGLDEFGHSVAVSGDTVVVGAPEEDSNATGVNGDGTNNSAGDSGAAYVFVRTAGVWSQQAYLKASNTGGSDQFGEYVAVSGDTVVVGAPEEDSSATGVNGNQTNDSASNAGAAYVFVRTAGVWSQQAYLKASNTETFDFFGRSVAVSGDTAVVGAPGEDSSATGVNGNGADNSASAAGAAYVFARTAGVWSQQAYLKASNTETFDFFGYSVAVSGGTVVVGARLEDSSATGVNGNQADNSGNETGAAYVFVRTAGVWSQQAYLKASNTGAIDEFGWSVAVSGDTVVVGAHTEDSSATGVNGNQADDSATFAGAAYVFVRTAGVWSQQAYLKASNTGGFDHFGYSVAVSGGTVVVGAPEEDSSATGVNGNQADNSASSSGAAYVYALTLSTDLQLSKSGPGSVTAGQNLTYTLTLTNDGPAEATGVTVTDNLPASTTFVSCNADQGGVCGGTGNNRTINFASLAPGVTATITLVASVNCAVANGTLISNTANVTSETPDSNPGNDSATATTTASNPVPVVTSSVATSSLWPPNHKLVNVGLSAGATDNCGTPTLQVFVYGDEDDQTATSSGEVDSPDAKNIGVGTLRLRSERVESGDGRVYLIVVKATDSAGGVGFSAHTVVVTKSQSAANINGVNSQATAARNYALSHNGNPPAGYFVIGDGPVIGPQQ